MECDLNLLELYYSKEDLMLNQKIPSFLFDVSPPSEEDKLSWMVEDIKTVYENYNFDFLNSKGE